MPIECRQSISGGKGNRGMFIERDTKIVAAGLPTAQQNEAVEDSLQHYMLVDEVDALLSDAIIPAPKTRPLPPLRKPIPLDMRHSGTSKDMAEILRPQEKTKFENLVDEFKETSYKSYWHTPIGKTKDPVPMLPEGFDITGTTFGKATPFHGRLYDLIMPKEPHSDKTPPSKQLSVQLDRKYCPESYNPDLTYGHRTFVDKRGTYARCCITDDRVVTGTSGLAVVNSIQANLLDAKQPRMGSVLAPNKNINYVPDGYAFGILKPPDKLPECLSFCEMNKEVYFFRKCLGHLNTVRRGLSTRLLPTFFQKFYLRLKYDDIDETGWLPKEVVYKHCGFNLIRFDPSLMEPLLSMWKAFDGSRIDYKTFVRIINYRIPSPEIPKIPDFKLDCLDYRTTYKEMVKSGQVADDRHMAGLPSGRYFDLDYPKTPEGYCAADKICLSHETDMRCCINPSILAHVFVDHRDMYQKQEPSNVRRVFEATGEKFSDERFDFIWKEAQKYHSEGWVCYQTFRQALEKYPDHQIADSKTDESNK